MSLTGSHGLSSSSAVGGVSKKVPQERFCILDTDVHLDREEHNAGSLALVLSEGNEDK